jgi:phospholipid/cholesterol/gamma-HCH transport system permease protein
MLDVLRELGAFAVITLGVTLTKFNASKRVVHPLIFTQIWNAGVRLLPMISFIGGALGLVIVGQTVALLSRVGAQRYIGTVMVTVIVRELGPLVTALIVLGRALRTLLNSGRCGRWAKWRPWNRWGSTRYITWSCRA